MTTKQIAEYLGKPEKTVRTWAASAAAKSAIATAKLAVGSPTKPADWDLEETCQIIAEGMGEDVADVYRTNAVNAELASRPVKSTRLPNGTQLRELRLMAAAGKLDKADLRRLLGLEAVRSPIAPLLPEPVASDEMADAAFASIRASLGARGARQVAGAVGRIVGEAVARKESDRKQGKLGL